MCMDSTVSVWCKSGRVCCALDIGVMAQELKPDPVDPKTTDVRDEGIVRRLNLLQEQVLREMKRMARPQEPYSTMVQAWIEGFKMRLLS